METSDVALLSDRAVITPWEAVTLANNYMFNTVMTANPDLCRRFIEHLLHIRIDRIEQPQSEFSIAADAESRGVRFDVYVTDNGARRVFDLEMQVTNRRNLPERARYYQGIIDESSLKPSENYTELRTSYILFLCLFDPFGRGLPVYTFQNRCDELPSLLLHDRTYKVFYNTKAYTALQQGEERAIFQLLLDGTARSAFTSELREKMEYARKNAQYRQAYMTLARLRREEREEGERKKALEAAHNFLQLGIAAEVVAKGTGLPLEEVRALQAGGAATPLA